MIDVIIHSNIHAVNVRLRRSGSVDFQRDGGDLCVGRNHDDGANTRVETLLQQVVCIFSFLFIVILFLDDSFSINRRWKEFHFGLMYFSLYYFFLVNLYN